MESLIDTIRAALAADATKESRAAGASACRTILSALEPAPGHPIDPKTIAPQIAAIGAALRGVPPDQVLDMAIAKLRASLPPGVEVGPPAIQFRMPTTEKKR